MYVRTEFANATRGSLDLIVLWNLVLQTVTEMASVATLTATLSASATRDGRGSTALLPHAQIIATIEELALLRLVIVSLGLRVPIVAFLSVITAIMESVWVGNAFVRKVGVVLDARFLYVQTAAVTTESVLMEFADVIRDGRGQAAQKCTALLTAVDMGSAWTSIVCVRKITVVWIVDKRLVPLIAMIVEFVRMAIASAFLDTRVRCVR